MINLKKRTTAVPAQPVNSSARFQEAFFSALSDVIFTDGLEKSITSIVSGIRRAFDGDTFLFRRSGETASLVGYSSDRADEITGLLRKAGVRLSADRVPLSGGRGKLFAAPFAEYDDLFALAGDLTTAAACRKMQHELQFGQVATASVKIEAEEFGVVILLHDKLASLRQDLSRFTLLLKAAHCISALKTKLHGLETKFDEQFIKLRNELREKESTHLFLFNDMPVAAAVLDERGVITEANDWLKHLAGEGTNPVGQSFSSLIPEGSRRDFIEFVMNVAPGEEDTGPVRIAGRDFKAFVVARKKEDGTRGITAVYLADTSAEMELQQELGRTIDALRADSEAAEKIAEEARKYSGDVVKGAGTPLVVISGGVVKLVSESAGRFLQVQEGQLYREFLQQNGISSLAEDEAVSETTDSRHRLLSVERWKVGEDLFLAFCDSTQSKKVEDELHRTSAEADKLFNGFLPTAAVKGETISKWNDMFSSLFSEFISSDRSFDGFLRYLGESPEAFRSELHAGGPVMRMSRTTDRKYLNVNATPAGETVFLFIEDITEQEILKQQLRNAQSLLSNSIESFVKEPVFVLENGVARAANVAARNMLSIRLDEPVDAAKILAGMGVTNRDETGELNGDFYRVESVTMGGSTVYRFRLVNLEVEQRGEIEKLKRRQEILRALSSADRFEAILQSLNDLIRNDGYVETKVVGTGTVQSAKEIGDVFLLTTATEKIEPSLSLSIGESDTSAVKRGGLLSKVEMPDTTFMNVISAGDSALLLQSTLVGDTYGFASVALPDTSVSAQYLDDLGKVLKAASSVAAGLQSRRSVERKFEDSGKVTRAIVGLTGMGAGSFEETARRSIDLLRQVFSAESVGVYSLEGASMALMSSNGTLPAVLSVPATRFSSMSPVNQLESAEMQGAEGFFFAVKSRSQKLAVMFRFVGVPPAPSELNAVSSLSLDILESKRTVEGQEKVTADLLESSKMMSEFMSRLTKAATPDEVVKVLGDSLAVRSKESGVVLKPEEESSRTGRLMEVVEQEGADPAVYFANFMSVGLGVITVRCSRDPMSRMMVELAVDKLRSIFALKLPAAQSEIAALRSRLDRAKEDSARLRESVDRIPASLRNARIEIDNVLSRLSYVVGDDKVMQEIRLHLASAAKEMSIDLDYSSRNQDELFESVRAAIAESGGVGRKIGKFDTSALTEFRADQAAFDLLKDLFVNFVAMSGSGSCDILMMTAQPSPNEASEGKGKHVSIRVTGGEDEILHDNDIKGSVSIQTLIGKLEKLGFAVDTRALGNEVTMDICEVKPAAAPGAEVLSALLVEDDKKLLEEESQNLLQVFSRLRVAGDAVEAARVFEAEKFSAAFVDLSLPSINGRELCRQIKSAQPGCVTVLLTNREGEERSEGVDHIALRPLEEETARSYIQ